MSQPGDDFMRKVMGAAQQDQVEAANKENAAVCWSMYQEFMKAGFTPDQAMQFVRDWLQTFTAARLAALFGGHK